MDFRIGQCCVQIPSSPPCDINLQTYSNSCQPWCVPLGNSHKTFLSRSASPPSYSSFRPDPKELPLPLCLATTLLLPPKTSIFPSWTESFPRAHADLGGYCYYQHNVSLEGYYPYEFLVVVNYLLHLDIPWHNTGTKHVCSTRLNSIQKIFTCAYLQKWQFVLKSGLV